jgi:predicted DNA-binding transcriptional regulator AlpA
MSARLRSILPEVAGLPHCEVARGPLPLLLKARQAATTCRVSLRTWRSWDSGGQIPRPIRIGRSTFWRMDELKDWTAAGCPRRTDWEART